MRNRKEVFVLTVQLVWAHGFQLLLAVHLFHLSQNLAGLALLDSLLSNLPSSVVRDLTET